jgi:hypothetical protein
MSDLPPMELRKQAVQAWRAWKRRNAALPEADFTIPAQFIKDGVLVRNLTDEDLEASRRFREWSETIFRPALRDSFKDE